MLKKIPYILCLIFILPCFLSAQDKKHDSETLTINKDKVPAISETPSLSKDKAKASVLSKIEVPHGIILLTKEGGRAWKNKIRTIAADIHSSLPQKTNRIEIVFGPSQSSLQSAIDKFTGFGIKKLLIIPVYLSSHDSELEYAKYILTLRKNPPAKYLKPDSETDGIKDFFKKAVKSFSRQNQPQKVLKQVDTDTEMIITPALDGALIAEALEQNIKFKENMCFAFFGIGSENKNYNNMRYAVLDFRLGKLKEKYKLKSFKIALFVLDSMTDINQKALTDLNKYHKESLQCTKTAAGYSLYEKHLDKTMEKALFGRFYNSYKTLTPAAGKIKKWIEQKIEQAKHLPPEKRFVKVPRDTIY
jgi:hypothetical protein